MTGTHPAPGPADSDAALSSALDEMAAVTDRLLESVDRMPPEAVGGPSLMPGWTRGHVLTHLARNADAITNLVLAARTGDGRPMYAGGPEGREAAIQAGAGRHLGDLRLDLDESAERLLSAFADGFPAEARSREVAMLRGATAYGWEIPWIRIREVEIHHVDLAADYTPARLGRRLRRPHPGPAGAVLPHRPRVPGRGAGGHRRRRPVGGGRRRARSSPARSPSWPRGWWAAPRERAWRCSPPAQCRRPRGSEVSLSRASGGPPRRSPSRRCPNPLVTGR